MFTFSNNNIGVQKLIAAFYQTIKSKNPVQRSLTAQSFETILTKLGHGRALCDIKVIKSVEYRQKIAVVTSVKTAVNIDNRYNKTLPGCDRQVGTGDEFGFYGHLARCPVLWKANCNFLITTSRLWAILSAIFVIRRRAKDTCIPGKGKHSWNTGQIRNYETVCISNWTKIAQTKENTQRKLTAHRFYVSIETKLHR